MREEIAVAAIPGRQPQSMHQALSIHARERLGVGLDQMLEAPAQVLALCGNLAYEAAFVLKQSVQHRHADRAAQVIVRESRAVIDAEVGRPRLLRADTSAEGHETATQRFGEQHDVRLEAVVLGSEQAPGTAEAGLDLI